MNKQDILAAYHFRHACKEFDANRQIGADDFNFILETARLSPSSFGLEPWKFLVVQNPQLREQLRAHVWGGQKQLPTASHVIVTLTRKCRFMRYDSDYVINFMTQVQQFPEEIIRTRLGIYEKFQRSDFQLLDSERAMTDWATKQTYLPMANMMTAAAMIGIDSCPIEGFDRADLEQVVAETMRVDLQCWSVAYLLAFGYRQHPPARPKTRQTQAAVVEWFE